MPWLMLFVALAVAGLAVLGVCAVRLYAAIRAFGRELERTRGRLTPGRAALKRELDKLEHTRE